MNRARSSDWTGPGWNRSEELVDEVLEHLLAPACVPRGLALGELSWSSARKALAKEATIGLGNGLALGLVAAGIAWATKSDPMLGLLLGMAMMVNMFVAATAGTLVPLGLKAMKVDPALASSVFITTFTDVVGFASFLGLATVFLRYLVKVQ